MKRFVLGVVGCFIALALPAQDYPMPGSASEAPVVCTTCPAQYMNLPTWPYDAPITGHAGRYLDSNQLPAGGLFPKAMRALDTKIAPEIDRVFMILNGGRFATYRLSTLLDAELGSPLATGPKGEAYLPLFSSVFPLDPGSGWAAFVLDGDRFLFGFDWDERGYRYLAYSIWGWGITEDDGSLVSQVAAPPHTPRDVVVLRSGDDWFAAVTDRVNTAIYDVTTPATPVLQGTIPLGYSSASKIRLPGRDVVALVDQARSLRVYEPVDLIAGAAPSVTFAPQLGLTFTDVTTDGLRWFALQSGGTPGTSKVSLIEWTGGAWTETVIDLAGGGRAFTIATHAGLLAVTGRIISTGFPPFLRLYRLGSELAQPVDVNEFFERYYATPPPGYARPGWAFFEDANVHLRNGLFHVFAAANGIGDVYELSLPAAGPPVMSSIVVGPTRVGSTLRVTPEVSDSDGDLREFYVFGLPAGATFDPLTGELVWTPGPDQIGSYPVRIGVADEAGGVDWQDALFVVPPPEVSIADASGVEGAAGSNSMLAFGVTLSTPSAEEVRVDWTTVDGTATAGSDYMAGAGTLIFPAGTTTATIEVEILGDDVPEGNETFEVALSSPVAATIADDRATGTITSDDAAAIPIDSPWVLMLLSVALAVAGVARMRA